MDTLFRWDQSIFYAINSLHHTLWDSIAISVHETPDWLWVVILGLATWLSKRKDRWKIFLFTCVLLFTVDFLNHEILKDLFKRSRPCNALTGVVNLVPCPRSFSFPSTHTMGIFAISVFLSIYYPKRVGLLVTVSIIVSLSRIAAGVHYPLDVLGGALVGTLCAILFWQIEKRIFKNKIAKQDYAPTTTSV